MKNFSESGEQKTSRKNEHSVKTAFGQLFYEYYGSLILYGSTLTDRQPLVEDQVQELFIWLYRHPRRYHDIDNMEAYLFLSLKRNIIATLKREARGRKRGEDYSKLSKEPVKSSEELWVDDDDERKRAQRLADAVSRLPPRMREVIYLRYYRCLGYDEIATIMSVSTQVARNFAFRALKKMRQAIPHVEWILMLVLISIGYLNNNV